MNRQQSPSSTPDLNPPEITDAVDQLIREHLELHKEINQLRELNRQLMDQLDKHVEANRDLLQRLKERDGEDKWEGFKMPRQKSDWI